MKLSKDRLLNFLTDLSLAYELPPLIEKVEEAIEALQNEELEIEGYERKDHFADAGKMAWTKFDPDDESTFPACNSELFLIAAQKSLESPTFTMMAEHATEALIEEIRNDIVKFKLNVYWRPLPPPPTESEK